MAKKKTLPADVAHLCQSEIAALLKKHNCSLHVAMEVSAQGNMPKVTVVELASNQKKG